MANSYDVIVIGGGHNGLVNAAYLQRAGKKVLVLERRHIVGGAACTEEIVPGFKFSVCSYVGTRGLTPKPTMNSARRCKLCAGS